MICTITCGSDNSARQQRRRRDIRHTPQRTFPPLQKVRHRVLRRIVVRRHHRPLDALVGKHLQHGTRRFHIARTVVHLRQTVAVKINP